MHAEGGSIHRRNLPMADAGPDIPALIKSATFTSSAMGGACSLHHDWRDGRLVLHVKGSTSTALPESFTDAVARIFAQLRPRQVAIDLSACASLHSVMLAFLVFFQKQADEHGAGKVVLYGVSPRITTMIKMIGMSDFFAVARDAAAVDEHFRQNQ